MSAQSPECCEELFAEYLNAGSVDRLLGLYEQQASHVRANGQTAQGSAAVRQVLEEFVAMQPQFRVSLKKIVPAGSDLAVLYDDWTLTAKDAGGKTAEMHGQGVHIVRRQPGGSWLFAVTGLTNAPW